jgi:ABC-type transport system involved in multi-copper enzyme maturation permease subunit
LRLAWLLYAGLGLFWIVSLLLLQTRPNAAQHGVAGINVFQVAVGLLLVSTSAATSLAEERVRGSLDVLLATPLSTPSILAGKWLGSLRQVAPVLIWPAMTGAYLAVLSGRWISYLLLLALVLAYGAAITSLGLALATWVSRLGRAVAVCVSAYIVFSIGWIVLIATLTTGPGVESVPMIMGSPLYGTYFASLYVSSESNFVPFAASPAIAVGCLFWIVAHGGAAAILFAMTLTTFDRCLGRISETAGRPSGWAGKKPSKNVEADLDEWLSARVHETSQPADS